MGKILTQGLLLRFAKHSLDCTAYDISSRTLISTLTNQPSIFHNLFYLEGNLEDILQSLLACILSGFLVKGGDRVYLRFHSNKGMGAYSWGHLIERGFPR